MTGNEYEVLWNEFQWLKENHPELKCLISFLEKFYKFAEDERKKVA